MIRLVLRRVGLAIPILVGVSVIVFLLMTVVPGSPEAGLVPEDATPEERAAIRDSLGLDDPLPLRYLAWVGNALQGDLGYSEQRRREVADLLGQAWGNTFVLALVSAVFGIALGLLLGYLAGTRRGKAVDRLVSVLSLGGLSVPSFFLAIILLAVFAGGLQLLPSGGADFDDPLSAARSLVLPVLSGSLITMAITARVTRAGIVDVLGADFVETLRAKGLSELEVRRHVLRNAISPVLTTSGVQIGALLGGSVLVETIFRWPGMGLLLYNAISARDLVVVQGATLVIALTFVVVNLLVDLLQAAIDPRVRGTMS
ncbi:ABC transporter permease [Desertihabitans brevis]|uniref:ABC transporter permease n=1 Tax=Desertihabitans brevis TaxID=2268447 RepID=A0A367YR28_9ACTN|nr:ABC transporter permease [Desertihabitans brevis]RCK67999.1 ABC transporter permease [Desertihabitans brevis]